VILLIDTYNVLHVTGVLPPELAGVSVEGLMRLIENSRYGHSRAELICDGVPTVRGAGEVRRGLVAVRYAGRRGEGLSADDLIAAMIRASSSPRRLIVVSSDNAVLREAKRRKCRVLSSEQFLRQLAEDAACAGQTGGEHRGPRPIGGLSDEQVEEWMEYFGVGERREFEPTALDAESMGPAASPTAEAEGRVVDDGDEPSPLPLPRELIKEAERLWCEGGDSESSGSQVRG
jgi:hypothetical protein